MAGSFFNPQASRRRSSRARRPLARSGGRHRLNIEALEDRFLPSVAVTTFAGNAQHTGLYSVPAQQLNSIHWHTPVDLAPQYQFDGSLLIHYGAPLITFGNTLIVPVKTGATDGFRIEARNAATGALKYTLSTDYTLNGMNFDWTPSYAPALAPDGLGGTRLYYAGAGGTIYYIDDPNSSAHPAPVQEAFYGLANYNANKSGFNSTVFIDTPITGDSKGDIFFGFRVENTAPAPLNTMESGYARIDAAGHGTFVLAGNAAADINIMHDSHNLAPALSLDQSTVYVAVKSFTAYDAYLLGLDSTTLATKFKVFLTDPRPGPFNNAGVLDDSTASPMIGPDGTVFFGVMGNPFNGSRGWMLHFSPDLKVEYTPGAFGWDNTAAIVPASMVPSYHGTSPFLLFTKYNNYANASFDSGDGVNKIAILDPYATEVEPHASSGGLLSMREVMTVAGPTPDLNNIGPGTEHAVREWCINTAAVDQAGDSVIVPSEDGNIYRWNLASGALTEAIKVGTGIGEAYVPTVIGPDGTIFTINNATLFAIGNVPGADIAATSSAPGPNNVVVGRSLTFTAIVTNPASNAPPTGTVTFQEGSRVLAAKIALSKSGRATFSTSSLSAGNHFISISYSGDANLPGGIATLVQTIHAFATGTIVTSSPKPSTAGQKVTFTATVIHKGSGTPTGLIRFAEGTKILAQVPLDSTGHATFSTSSLTAGSHTITAAYLSDPVFAGSTGSDSASPQIVHAVASPLSTTGLETAEAMTEMMSPAPAGAAKSNPDSGLAPTSLDAFYNAVTGTDRTASVPGLRRSLAGSLALRPARAPFGSLTDDS
jgi:hypothetical protein